MVGNIFNIDKCITFTDIIILQQIYQYTKFNKQVPSINKIHELVNDFIYKSRIPESHVVTIGRYRLQQTLTKLREFGMIEPTGKYSLTREGKSFTIQTNTLWQSWPIYIPMINQRPAIARAFYLKEY